MEAKEVVAYIKGAINLGKINSLSANEVLTFKNILKTQKQFEDSQEQRFCSWLNGYFDCLETQEVSSEKFIKICQKINEIENNLNVSNFHLDERLPGGVIAKC